LSLALDRFGMPKPATGGNAVVYKAKEPGGLLTFRKTWAIRCFLRPISDHAERYEAISKHLRKVRLPYDVNFQFLKQGIQIRSNWFPIVKMQSATVPTNIPNVAGKTTAKRLIVFQLSSFICRWRRWRGMSPYGNVFIPATT